MAMIITNLTNCFEIQNLKLPIIINLVYTYSKRVN